MPIRREGELHWPNGATLTVRAGSLGKLEPNGYGPRLATGFLKLELADPAARRFAQVTCHPDSEGLLEVEFHYPEPPQATAPAVSPPAARP